MDASLPSWPKLMSRLEQLLLDGVELEDFRRHASEDLQRRAEQLIHQKKPGRSLAHSFYQSLYEGDENSPGLLAQAIARLVASAGVDVEIVTTNFDNMLEKALETESIPVRSYSLHGTRVEGGNQPDDNLAAWMALTPDDRSRSILHLHGKVTRRSTQDPLILDEASFFTYGRQIQDLLSSRFENATVLLVGLSMTDPNVVAPLRATNAKGSGGQRFLLTVPPIPREADASREMVESSARFAVKNALLFGADLRTHTLMLKSYGQLIQVVSDLALDLAEPEAGGDTRYGVRFQRALRDAYKSLGCSLKSGHPKSSGGAEQLSRRMREASTAHGGPIWLLNEFRRKYAGECASQEQFGVFLWLRALGGSIVQARYEARLIAASTYVHWEGWSAEILEPIAAESRYSPSTALYYGRPTSRNIPAGTRGVWRGTFAAPLIQYGAVSTAQTPEGSWLDQLSLGAVAINSTKSIEHFEGMTIEDKSIISVVSRVELDALQDSIRTFEERIFSGTMEQ